MNGRFTIAFLLATTLFASGAGRSETLRLGLGRNSSQTATAETAGMAGSLYKITSDQFAVSSSGIKIGSTLTPSSFGSPESAQWYQIDSKSTSSNSALANFVLHVLSAQIVDNSLLLRVAFEYEGDNAVMLTAGFKPDNIRLIDAAGNVYRAKSGDRHLLDLDPSEEMGSDEFIPGGAVVGNLVFPLPTGNQPYALSVPTYEKLSFSLDRTLPSRASKPIPAGIYDVGLELRSTDEKLAPISLRVDTVEIDDKQARFRVAFVNTSRNLYRLWGVGAEAAARLLDGERRQYFPFAVSENISNSIAPADGWKPGEAQEGAISFALPTAFTPMRFVFRWYPALTLQLNENGLLDAEVTSVTGGSPPLAFPPNPSDVAFQNLNAFLQRQANAIISNDVEAYLDSFAPELHLEQRMLFDRMANLPLQSYSLTLDPGESLEDAESGTLQNIKVLIEYTLEGVPEGNPFKFSMEYGLVLYGDSWKITNHEYNDSPPFWFSGDVVSRYSDHFLIFTRAESATQMPTLIAEMESAYAMLSGKGLPLESRYVACLTGPDEDLSALAGQFGSRLLGLAVSQYAFGLEGIGVNSRAFYINGRAFGDRSDRLGQERRANTILHELVHLVFSKESRPFIPPWLNEGLAVYYSGQASPHQLHALVSEGQLDKLFLRKLTGVRNLGEHDFFGEKVSWEYLYSGAVVRYLVERYGEDAVMEFYRFYTSIPDNEVTEQVSGVYITSFGVQLSMLSLAKEKTVEAVQVQFNRTLEQLDADVKAWLSR